MAPLGILLLWLAVVVWSQPEDGTDAAGMLGLSLAMMGLAGLGGAVALGAVAMWRRTHPPRQLAPIWQPDPWGQAAMRYWDGQAWTHYTA